MSRIKCELEQSEEWAITALTYSVIGRHYLYDVALSAGVTVWRIEYETDIKPYAFWKLIQQTVQAPKSRRELCELLW